jgi:hypothetical protein
MIPRLESREKYGWMVGFAETVRDQRLAQRLATALDGRGAFRRFRQVLRDDPAEEQRWYKWEQDALTAYIGAWLQECGIAPEAKQHTDA